MSDERPPPKRPVFAVTALVLLGVMGLLPCAGSAVTESAIDDTPRDGQNFGLVILTGIGIMVTAGAIGAAGLLAAVAGLVSLGRDERLRPAALAGVVVGGVAFSLVAGSALYVLVAS